MQRPQQQAASRLRIHVRQVLWALGVLSATPALAHAGFLYALTSNGSPGAIYKIDTDTGAATPFFTLQGINTTSGGDLTILDGVLYATNVYPTSSSEAWFGTFDVGSAAFRAIQFQGSPRVQDSSGWHGMATNPEGLYLWVVDLSHSGHPLLQVGMKGGGGTLGFTNFDCEDLAYDVNHHTLYGIDASNALWEINHLTGASTRIGATGLEGNGALMSLAYDRTADRLFLNDGVGHNLYTLNPSTGEATLVGPNGVSVAFDGLADTYVPLAQPEPATLMLLALGLPVLLGRRRPARPS